MDNLVQSINPLVSRARTDVCWVKPLNGKPSCIAEPLTATKIRKHLNGGPAYGVAFIRPGTSTTRIGSLDFDSHGGQSTWEEMVAAAESVYDRLLDLGMHPTVFRSTGGRGIHIYLIWDEEQDAYSVRRLLNDALKAAGLRNGTAGVSNGQVEVFPKQNSVPADGFGNMVVLPLAGASVPLDTLSGMLDMPKDAPVDWQPSPPVPFFEHEVHERAVVPPSSELADLRRALMAIPQEAAPLSYDEWRNVIFAIHHASNGGGDGLSLAHEFSSRSSKYDPDFLDSGVWPYIKDDREGGITDRYILGLAASYGYSSSTADDFEDLDQTEPLPKKKQRRFAPIQAAIFAAYNVPVQWHIHGILPAEGVSMVYGASGSGKTFVVLDMAIAVARGEPWRGVRTHKGRVVYVVAESSGGFRKRLNAFSYQHGINLDQIDIHIIPVPVNIMNREQLNDLIDEIKLLGDVRLVVLDTFARVTTGADENSAQDMGIAMNNAQRIAEECGCSVLLVHHSGKEEGKGARGSSAIKAALDAELEVTRSEEDRVLRVTKLKDGEEGAAFGFRLLTIQLGMDEFDEPITSCVVEHNDASASRVKKGKKLGMVETTVRAAVTDLAMTEDGLVNVDDVIEEAISRLDAPADGARDRRPERVQRALAALIDAGFVERGEDKNTVRISDV